MTSEEKTLWQEKIQVHISELKKDKTLAFFLPLLEKLDDKLKQVSNLPEVAEHYKILEGLIGIFKDLKKYFDIQNGQSPVDVWNKVITEHYEKQDNWAVRDVLQPRGDLYQFYFGDVLDDLLKINKPSEPVPVPMLLVVMDAKEADELEDQIINKASNDIHSEDFKKLLVNNWKLRYKNNTTNNKKLWQPFANGKNDVNIQELMDKALSCVNGFKPLTPDIIDIRTVNRPEMRVQLKSLRQYGCIIIIDVISMAHPDIQYELLQSGLISNHNTLIASIFPISKELEIIQNTISVVEEYINKEFYHRFTLDLDNQCARVTSNIDINRWIKEQILKILPDNLKIQETDKQGFPQSWGQFGGEINQ
jgi:hypothetical protein